MVAVVADRDGEVGTSWEHEGNVVAVAILTAPMSIATTTKQYVVYVVAVAAAVDVRVDTVQAEDDDDE